MVKGFFGIQSASMLVRISLKEGTTIDNLPHQLRHFGGNCLIVVPECSPLCLRCKRTGHIRQDCRVLRCFEYYCLGHESGVCLKTYALAVGHPKPGQMHEMTMDVDEA